MEKTAETNPFTLRPAGLKDLGGIMSVENGSFGSDRLSPDLMDKYLHESLAHPEKTSLVVAFGKAAYDPSVIKTAGYALADFDAEGHGHIVSMAVKKDFRGQHLSRILLEQVSENLRKAGATEIVLEVESTNKVAIHLYETSGFVKDHVIPNYYGKKRDANYMVRKL